jgi:hypothetical protein
MSATLYRNLVFTAIALLLAAIAFKPAAPVHAQSDPDRYYVEPRTYPLRKPDGTAQLQGKVIIDMQTGDIYGFPTLEGVPYPVDRSGTTPPVSEPMYLGRFDLGKMRPPK